ncbi:MAG: hypothetical protein HYT10_02130 [Candidatus Levybacteria bacterium]|nr:hypothetical protein [Candidatus Levybacteria bacterium]
MRKEITIDRYLFVTLYREYKVYFSSLLVMIVSLVLLILFVLPQIQIILSDNQQINAEKELVSILGKNVSFLSSTEETQQSQDFQTVIHALPSEKDFSGILTAIQIAAVKTGVGVGDYSFQVGNLSTTPSGKTLPRLTISLTLNGSISSVAKFLAAMNQSLPLSEVQEISLGDRVSSIIISFYYKPLPPSNFNYSQPIPTLTQQKKDLLEKIKSWEKTVSTSSMDSSSGIGTSSATTGF